MGIQLVLPFSTFEAGMNKFLLRARNEDEIEALLEVIEACWEREYSEAPPSGSSEESASGSSMREVV